MSLLIVGSTGIVGRQILKEAIVKGYSVKCLVRDFRRSFFLKELGGDFFYGDLSIPYIIPLRLVGIKVVIDSSTLRISNNYTIETIDWIGKLALIEASKLCGIKKFIYFSLVDAFKFLEIPLLNLKVKVEKELKKSGLNYTIFECLGFFQGLLNEYAVPILKGQIVWLSDRAFNIRYLDAQDVSKAVIGVLNYPFSLWSLECYNRNVSLVGDKFWESREIVKLCERLSGKVAKTLYISSSILDFFSAFFGLFQFTWNISDRLKFSGFSNTFDLKDVTEVTPIQDYFTSEITWPYGSRIKLEIYLRDFFMRFLSSRK